MRKTVLIAGVLATTVLLASASWTRAEEHSVTLDVLPPAARKTAIEQSRGATVRGMTKETEHGQTQYEIELTVNGHARDVLIAPDGAVAEVEEEVAMAALPAPVKAALEREAGQGLILKVEAITKKGTLVSYEARVQNAGKKSEVTVAPDGRLLTRQDD